MTDRIFYGKPLVFRPNNHRYFWGGDPVPSVTTILGRLNKPALIQWAADKAVDAMREGKPPEEARLAHSVEARAGADIGTTVHDYAERIQRGEPWDMAEIARDIPAKHQKPVEEALGQLRQWLAAQKLQKGETERMVMSRELFYAGRTDRWGIINNTWSVLDFKTSNGVYDDHWIQLAGYEWALREETGIIAEPINHIIIHLDKNTGRCVPHVRTPAETRAALSLWENLVAVDKFSRLMPKREREKVAA